MTKNHLIFDNAVMISSTMPSAKYSCSGSPLMFWNGRTAIDGLSRKGGCARVAGSGEEDATALAPASSSTR